MGKSIGFEYNDKPYCLEFTRASVVFMEKQGFQIAEVVTKPMNTIPKLFRGAFMAHHPNVSNEEVEEIYDSLSNRGDLCLLLAEMYNDTVESLLGDSPEGKTEWTKSW